MSGTATRPEAEAGPGRRSGPTPGASREEVLAVARERFLACERVDVRAIAAECGIGRATIYRWFGSREELLGAAMMDVFADRVARVRGGVGGGGAEALLETIDAIYGGLASAPHVRALIERERDTALPLITSTEGPVHPRIVALIEGMIEAEVEAGRYEAPVEPPVLAYVLVRLAEALLFNHSRDEVPDDAERLRAVVATLLGASAERAEGK